MGQPLVTFDGSGFSPTIGSTSFSDIIDNATFLASSTTVFGVLANEDGRVLINSSNLTGLADVELFLFANFGDSEFGLWRDIVTTGAFEWIGRSDASSDILDLDSTATFTSFAGSFNDGTDEFTLEVVPEPST